MQPLIQPILSQIIDSCFYFPERFCDFSCWKYPQELQLLHLKTSYHLNRVFGQKFTRNAKNGFECLKLIWSGTFAICSTQPLWLWSRIGSRVKISHYIQPSNLSSALSYTFKSKVFFTFLPQLYLILLHWHFVTLLLILKTSSKDFNCLIQKWLRKWHWEASKLTQ